MPGSVQFCGCSSCRPIGTTDDEYEKARREYSNAVDAGRRLFLSLLDEENARLFDGRQCVYVTGSHGGRYRIDYGYSGNVFVVDKNGFPIRSLCAHPDMDSARFGLPEVYAMIVQLLAITTDEPGFLEIANPA